MSYIHINVLMFPAHVSNLCWSWDVNWLLNCSDEGESFTCLYFGPDGVWLVLSGGLRRSCTWWSCSSTTCSTTSRKSVNTGTSLHCKSVSLQLSHTQFCFNKKWLRAKKITYNFLLRVAFRDSVVQPVNDEWMNPCSLWSQVQPQCGGPGPSAVPHLRLLHSGISRPLQ